MKFPTIAEVARDLKEIGRGLSKYGLPEDEEGGCDVRLQVLSTGAWTVWSGDAQYDTDHRGYWGASSIPFDGHFNATEVAKDLISQAKEAAATSGGSSPSKYEVPNLDGMYPDELRDFARKYRGKHKELITTYAKEKARAIELREKGDIGRASSIEAMLEGTYRRLPHEMKW
jgi:hypothetical protein